MHPEDFARLTARFVDGARADERVVGLIALGSTAGRSRAPDAWSDHDVWFVTRDGLAPAVRNDATIVPDHHRVVVRFAETEHGRSVIYDDGHLVEYAVFDESELDIAGTNEHVVLYDESDITRRMAAIEDRTLEDAAGTDPTGASRFGSLCAQLTIGVTRAARGETMSANFMIRGQAVASLTWLVGRCVPSEWADRLDTFDPHRRFEVAHPGTAAAIDEVVRESPVDAAAGLLDLAERLLPGHVDGADPAAFAAVRATIERVRRAMP
ncbi:MAG: hypothetical protein AAFP84_16475 [Actinomycetota bacterium]